MAGTLSGVRTFVYTCLGCEMHTKARKPPIDLNRSRKGFDPRNSTAAGGRVYLRTHGHPPMPPRQGQVCLCVARSLVVLSQHGPLPLQSDMAPCCALTSSPAAFPCADQPGQEVGKSRT